MFSTLICIVLQTIQIPVSVSSSIDQPSPPQAFQTHHRGRRGRQHQSDVQQLLMALDAMKAHTDSCAAQVLADAGYRSEAVMAELAQTQPNTELVIALGREGKVLAKPRDTKRYPHTVAMAARVRD